MIKSNPDTLALQPASKNREISRLLSAAVINSCFCSMLLCDPASAASAGYAGESFSLDHGLMEKISAIHADSLSEFAARLSAI